MHCFRLLAAPSKGTRLFSSQTRFFLKPFTIASRDMLLSVNIIKATFGYKKDYVTVSKAGVVTFEFIPMFTDSESKKGLNIQARKVFPLSPNNIGVILSITDNRLDTFFQMDCKLSHGVEEKKDQKTISFIKEEEEKDVTIRFSV